MNQQELEALLGQIAPNNDPRRLVFSEATDEAEVESTNPQTLETTKKKVPVRVLQWTDPATGQTLKVQMGQDGTYTKTFQGIDPKAQGAAATTPAQVAADELGTVVGTRENRDAAGNVTKVTTYRRPDGTTYDRADTVTTQQPTSATTREQVEVNGQWITRVTTKDTAQGKGEVYYEDGQGRRVTPPRSAADQPKPEQAPDGSYGYWDRTGPSPQWVPIPNGPQVQRTPVLVDGQWGVWQPGTDGVPRFQAIQTVKPADIPVLQAKYGEVAQGLGQVAAELNGRLSRGEITEKQRNEAFGQAHQQASMLVSEINGMIDNSRASWAQEIAQRGQTFTEAANRRNFAGSVLNNAVSEGARVAMSAGPGHGAAIAGGVGALLGIGQQYAQGMGGLPEMGEVRMPRALEQARDVGLPGMGTGAPMGGTPGPGGMPPSGMPPTTPPNAIGVGSIGTVPAPGGPPAGVSNTTDAGGVPRVRTPASATNAPPIGMQPAGGGPAGGGPAGGGPAGGGPAGGGPAGMGAALGMGMQGSPMGMPAAMGGGGLFDPSVELQSMLGASTSASSFGGEGGADASWEDAARRAYAEASKYGGF